MLWCNVTASKKTSNTFSFHFLFFFFFTARRMARILVTRVPSYFWAGEGPENEVRKSMVTNFCWMPLIICFIFMVGHLFQNYDTIYVWFFPTYLQSFLLHDIRVFFCHLYLRFIPKYMTIFLQTRIYMRTKKPIYMCYKQACGICGRRKSSYKRHRIIPSAKNPFMYDGAEK